MSQTKAVAALRDKCKPDVTMSEVAKTIGVSRQQVWAWLEEKSRPSLEHMIALRDAYGIAVEDWKK